MDVPQVKWQEIYGKWTKNVKTYSVRLDAKLTRVDLNSWATCWLWTCARWLNFKNQQTHAIYRSTDGFFLKINEWWIDCCFIHRHMIMSCHHQKSKWRRKTLNLLLNSLKLNSIYIWTDHYHQVSFNMKTGKFGSMYVICSLKKLFWIRNIQRVAF